MRRFRSEEGSVLLELALVLSMTVLFFANVSDYALWVRAAIQLQNAAAAGAAYGTIPGHATDTAGMIQVTNFNATGSKTGAAGVTVNATSFYACSPGGAQVPAGTTCSGGAPLQYVKVTASSRVTALNAFPGMPGSLTIPAQATFRVEGTP